MGQIGSKDQENKNQKFNGKENISSIGINNEKHTLNDVTIKVEDTSDHNEDVKLEQKDEDKDDIKPIKRVNAYDFACTIFYSMVALLVFTTISRTYSTHYRGGCGSVYASQSLLAYTCVGMACVIIRRLRKQISEQVRPLPEFLARLDLENEHKTDSNGYELFNGPLTPVNEHVEDKKPVDNKEIEVQIKPRTQTQVPDTAPTESIGFIQNSEQNKNYALLPLPLLPPPKSNRRSNQTAIRSENFSVLSAADLSSYKTSATLDTGSKIELNKFDNQSAVKSNCDEFDFNKINSLNDYPINDNHSTKTNKTFWDTYDLNDNKY